MRSMARIFLIASAIFGGIMENASAERMASKGLICDSLDEVKRYAWLTDQGYSEDEAVATVNSEFDDPTSPELPCAISLTTYFRGAKQGEEKVRGGIVEFYDAVIIAVFRDGEWFPVRPIKQFLPFFVPKVSHGSAI